MYGERVSAAGSAASAIPYRHGLCTESIANSRRMEKIEWVRARGPRGVDHKRRAKASVKTETKATNSRASKDY